MLDLLSGEVLLYDWMLENDISATLINAVSLDPTSSHDFGIFGDITS